MSRLPFDLPPVQPGEPAPVWTGRDFAVGETRTPVIIYDAGPSGWSDELTALHEDETASGTHFIDVASRNRAVDHLVRHGFAPDASVLEIGVSGGHLLADLRARFPDATLVGSDYTLGTLMALAPRADGIPLIRMDLTKSPLPDDAVDAIVLLNVLEHIDDDQTALNHCCRMLKPGGLVVIEVPAGPGLFDDYDRELMHFRRYSTSDLEIKARKAGFDLLEQSFIGCLIFPAFWVSKKWARQRPKLLVGDGSQSSRVRSAIRATAKANGVGHWLMAAEGALARMMSLPFGIRCVLVGKKINREISPQTPDRFSRCGSDFWSE